MKKRITWVVIADHQHIRVLRHDRENRKLLPVEGWSEETHLKPNRALVTERPGRSFASAGTSRSAIEPKSEPRRMEAFRFLADFSERLCRAADAKSFDRIILVAPPRALGEMRELLPASVKEKVVGEVNEDLVKHPLDAVMTRLADHLLP